MHLSHAIRMARLVFTSVFMLLLSLLVLWSCERVEDPQKTNPFEPGSPPDFNLVAELSAHHDTVSLNWDAVAGRGVRGYRLFRYGTLAEKIIEDALADLPDTVLSYADDTIIGGTTYLYKVAALDAAGRASDVEGQEGVEVQVPARGRIEITTTPDDAPWTVFGPQLEEGGSGDTVYEDQLQGSYTITWRELEGWERPDPNAQTGSLAPGDTLRFSGIYIELSTSAITDVSPDTGPTSGGTEVTITGANLQNTSNVTFGGTAAGLVQVSATQVRVTTPAHAAGAVDVVLTTSGGQATATNGFTYVAGPTITTISPDTGPTSGGTEVTITSDDHRREPSVHDFGDLWRDCGHRYDGGQQHSGASDHPRSFCWCGGCVADDVWRNGDRD